MEKILIDDALTKIYDYRMLQCYLDFEDKDTPLINFSNQNCKNDIIDKRLIIVNNNNSPDYKSCQKSIIQSIKYYEKGFIPKSIQKPWRRASSPRANAMFLDQEERGVDNQIIENELTNFIESQRYRLYCSIMRTSDNILEMRYPHIYTTIEPTGDIDVYDATQIEKLRNDCIFFSSNKLIILRCSFLEKFPNSSISPIITAFVPEFCMNDSIAAIILVGFALYASKIIFFPFI